MLYVYEGQLFKLDDQNNVNCFIQYLYFVHNKSTTFYTLHYILYKWKEKFCEKQTSVKK